MGRGPALSWAVTARAAPALGGSCPGRHLWEGPETPQQHQRPPQPWHPRAVPRRGCGALTEPLVILFICLMMAGEAGSNCPCEQVIHSASVILFRSH